MSTHIAHQDFHEAKFHRPDRIHQKLYVVTPLINPKRFRARWKHITNFSKHIIDSGAHLVLVEVSYGERDHVFTEPLNDRMTILNIVTTHELWHKENILNIGIAHLTTIDANWKYVATVDGDITFARWDWVGECLHKLQHHPIIQMFSEVAYLGPEGQLLTTSLSFMEGWKRGIPFITKDGKAQSGAFYKKHLPHDSCGPYDHHHHKIGWAGAPGAAWAYRREALNHLGGLIDFAILGSGDYHMATALMGFLHISLQKDYHKEYIQWMMDWQEKAIKHIKYDVGHMKGLILHHWHGKMKDRGYGDRWKILIKHQYNPRLDIKKDTNGLWQLEGDKHQLRDDVRDYFAQRNEDSIDL